MSILEKINHFSNRYGKEIIVGGKSWRYYRLGEGKPLLWLGGGLRRTALYFAFMERLAARHTVIAPDYPPVQTFDEHRDAFDAMLHTEGVDRFFLGGQSYGGMLAQAYLVSRCITVERLILSSAGPLDGGKAWLPLIFVIVTLARRLPERTVKNIIARMLIKLMSAPAAEQAEWRSAIKTLAQTELVRADVISHFKVMADLIRKSVTHADVLSGWSGRILVLRAENDPTQGKGDPARYERLFRRTVEVVEMGRMGHTAALFDPDRYTAFLEQALK